MKYWSENMNYWSFAEVENYQHIMELADKLSKEKRTPAEAMQNLINAGIFDENGNYTEPYKILEQYTPLPK